MTTWSAFADAAPDLAAEVRLRLDARVHKTLATIRRDGSPRISGTETRWLEDDLWLGAMWRSTKALDLRRDPRFALHGGSDDPPAWTGDAKVSGRAVEVTDPRLIAAVAGAEAGTGPAHVFRLDIRAVSTVALDPDGAAIVVTSWSPDAGIRVLRRT